LLRLLLLLELLRLELLRLGRWTRGVASARVGRVGKRVFRLVLLSCLLSSSARPRLLLSLRLLLLE
jgi:hypothetical protein